jgi:hypothetical protein
VFHPSSGMSLAVIGSILVIATVLSVAFPKKKKEEA